MTTKTFDLWQAYQASPVIWGAVQDISQLSFVAQATPFTTAAEPSPKSHYSYDDLGQLTALSLVPAGTVVSYAYDAAGNRTSVIVTQGLGGL